MNTDTLNRRLRFAAPNPLVRRLQLVDADILAFEAINRHGPLPSHYLYEFTKHVRRDKTHLINRLTEFYNGDATGPFLTRPQQQFAGFMARYQHLVYDLAPRAQTFVSPLRSRKDPFLHRLMQACISASFELSASARGLHYISLADILAHPRCGDARDAANPLALPLPALGPSASLIPDDLFGIEYRGTGFRFFALEIDRNTESIERKNLEQNTFGKKVTAYHIALVNGYYHGWWGIPNLSVLTVTTNIAHAQNILDYIKKQTLPKLSERFAITVASDFGPNWRVPKAVLSNVLDKPWQMPMGTRDISVP